MIPFLIVLLILCFLYVLALMGRKGHSGLAELKGWAYAHRGLHGGGVPENSMEAFRLALEKGYGIELDIHLMKDGDLAVIHDASLKRTAGADIRIEELTGEDLKHYRLEGTQEQIPLFSQVLSLYKGKAPLIVELKAENGNHAALCEAACRMLDGYEGVYCLESFDPRCIAWLRKHRPDKIRGQLTENFLAGKGKMPWIIKFVMTTQLLNFITRPDFIAYKFADRKRLGNFLCRRLWGLQGVTWTIKTREDYDAALEEGWIPIFESFTP